MTFWSTKDLSPTRQFRFMVSNGADWWWASACTKPSFEVSSEEYKLVNHKFKYPGVATWNDVTLTIVDVSGQATILYNSLLQDGHDIEKVYSKTDGLSKKEMSDSLYYTQKAFHIKQLDDDGNAVETWSLRNPFIKSINFGQLDYASEELVKIELVISYDYAKLEKENNEVNSDE